MPQECTTLAIIWPREEPGESRYELWENFRPLWRPNGTRPAATVVSGLDYPLATLIALHLARAGQLERITGVQLPASSRTPLALSGRKAHQLYRALEGRAVSVVRYHASLVSDRELACLRRAGVRADLLDPDRIRAGEWR